MNLTKAEFHYGLHKRKKQKDGNTDFVDVGRITGTGLKKGATVKVVYKTNPDKHNEWSGTLTQDNEDKDGNDDRFLIHDLKVSRESKDAPERGTEDLTVTVTNVGGQPASVDTTATVIP